MNDVIPNLDQISVNDDGIPTLLLNNDWLKLIEKKGVRLPKDFQVSDIQNPPIIKTTKQPLPHDALENLLKILKISVLEERFEPLIVILQYFTKDSQKAFALELERIEPLASGNQRWFVGASAWLYGDSVVENVHKFMKFYSKHIGNQCEFLAQYAINCHRLSEIGIDSKVNEQKADTTLRLLLTVLQRGNGKLRPDVESALSFYGKYMGLSTGELADRLIPTLGLDNQGRRVFDYGSRQFIMRLDSDFEPSFIDNKGKKFKNLPKPNANDDSEKASLAQAEFKAFKADFARFKQEDLPRLECLLVSQRKLKWADFERYYVQNRLMHRFTMALIWATYTDDNQVINTFRIDETGIVLDIEGQPKTLPTDSLIGLIHPLDLSENERGNWGQALFEEHLIQPIVQLGRPIFTLTDDEKRMGKIERFANDKFIVRTFKKLRNEGWELILAKRLKKTFLETTWEFEISGYLWDADDNEKQHITNITIPENPSDISISEFLYSIVSLPRVAE